LNELTDEKAALTKEFDAFRETRDAEIYERQSIIDDTQIKCRDAQNQVDALKTTSQASVSESQRQLHIQEVACERRIAQVVEEKEGMMEAMEAEKQSVMAELKASKERCKNA